MIRMYLFVLLFVTLNFANSLSYYFEAADQRKDILKKVMSRTGFEQHRTCYPKITGLNIVLAISLLGSLFLIEQRC